ncbi:f1d0f2e1-c34e-4c60-9e21-5772c0f7bc74 [Sclerotinia trifoliorum]|uniref:F1d0f2e1-c34e-4c60-9e21-5772c0f7bc74 n=1 Tax=Sclerotinia trifoliorum TaxID=28548 RepID=A0A8H2VNT8_9HELO|nr:f1d0f2e1-c34e-4c60-9e21-5772c0f7bc74 [Sclerotinia trifoliorum]
MTTLDFPNQKVHAENDTSNSLVLANKKNMTELHIMFNKLEILDDPELQPFGPKTVLLLISAASIDQLNNTLIDGRRLLHITLSLKQDQLSQALLDRGIDAISLDEGNPPRTALEMLCIYGSRDKKLIGKILSNHADKTALSARGSTMLHLACFNNQISVPEEVLLAGWKADILSRDGQPLILAGVQSGDTRIVSLLLQYGCILLDQYISPSNLVFSLAYASNSLLCEFLHEHGINDWHQKTKLEFRGHFIPGISMMEIDDYPALSSGTRQQFLTEIEDVTPLHSASYRGTKEIVQYALDIGSKSDLNLTASFGTTPLFLAIYGIQHDTIELLLSYSATTSELYGPRKLTPLHLAVVVGNELVVKSLLQYGADAQARDGAELTPSMIALDLVYESIAKILAITPAKLPPSAPVCSDSNILAGATEPVGGNNPLLKAFVTNSHKEIIHYLLDNGASLDGVVTCTKPIVTARFTPLHQAAMLGDEQIMEKILKLGKPTTHQKVYPLHIAAYNCHFACVRLLLNHDLEGKCGVDVKTSLAQPRCLAEAQMVIKHIGVVKGICGTALHYYSWENHVNTIKELLRAGADPNTQEMKGKTPLHIAAENGQHQACQIVEDMINQDASIDILLEDGGDLLHYACCFGNTEIVEILIAAGLNINWAALAPMWVYRISPLKIHKKWYQSFVECETKEDGTMAIIGSLVKATQVDPSDPSKIMLTKKEAIAIPSYSHLPGTKLQATPPITCLSS